MTRSDVGTAAGVLQDLSKFDQLADPLQQGVLNFLFLGRLMKRANGLVPTRRSRTAPAIRCSTTGELYYDGNSQGGIDGGLVTAVATDLTRSVLGVSASTTRCCCPAAPTSTPTRPS